MPAMGTTVNPDVPMTVEVHHCVGSSGACRLELAGVVGVVACGASRSRTRHPAAWAANSMSS